MGRDKVFRMQLHEAKDMALNAPLEAACKNDFTRFPDCNISTRLFLRRSCLRKHSTSLSPTCRAELFWNRLESSGDLRLNYNVLLACKAEVKWHCADKQFGEARVLNCLWQRSIHGGAGDFSHDCHAKVENLKMSLSRDYRLDFSVRSYCGEDINAFCAAEKNHTDSLSITQLLGGVDAAGQNVTGQAGQVLNCLSSKRAGNPPSGTWFADEAAAPSSRDPKRCAHGRLRCRRLHCHDPGWFHD